MKKILKWVNGNPFDLAIPLEKEVFSEGTVRRRMYVPPNGSVVTVKLVGGGGSGNKSYTGDVDGNVVMIHENGTLAVGIYDVEVRVVEHDGTLRRSMWTKKVQIVRNNGEVLQQWDDFAEMSGEQLDAAVFLTVDSRPARHYRMVELDQNITVSERPDEGYETGVMYVNRSQRSFTVTIVASRYVMTPDGRDVILTVPAGGYGEVSFVNVGGTVFARGV